MGFGLSRFFALISTSLIHAAAELQNDRPQAGLQIGLEAVEQLANLFGQALAVSSLLSVCSLVTCCCDLLKTEYRSVIDPEARHRIDRAFGLVVV